MNGEQNECVSVLTSTIFFSAGTEGTPDSATVSASNCWPSSQEAAQQDFYIPMNPPPAVATKGSFLTKSLSFDLPIKTHSETGVKTC